MPILVSKIFLIDTPCTSVAVWGDQLVPEIPYFPGVHPETTSGILCLDHANLHFQNIQSQVWDLSIAYQRQTHLVLFVSEWEVDIWLFLAHLFYLQIWLHQGTVFWRSLPAAQDRVFSSASFLFSVAPLFSGKPLTLNCTVRFGFEELFKPVIKWYIKDSNQEWEVPTPEGKR